MSDFSKELDGFLNETSQLISQQDIYLTPSVVLDLPQLVEEISSLISLPEIYLKIRELMDDQSSSIKNFAEVVSTDPNLTTTVLKVVNSAFFGFAGQIKDIDRAVNMLGIGQLHDLVLGISAIECFQLDSELEPLKIYWQRSIFCGVLSRLLAEHLHLNDAGVLFVIGLLTEVGRLALFLKYPNECRLAVIQALQEKKPLTVIEKDFFGYHYGQVGQALTEKWNLPEKFTTIIGAHPDPEQANQFVQETLIVHIAHQLATNKFPGPDNYQCIVQPEQLTHIDSEVLNSLLLESTQMSGEMENLILGS